MHARRAESLRHEPVQGRAVVENAGSEEPAQRFGGTFEDPGDPGVAQQLRRDIGFDVASAAKELHEVIGRAPEPFGCRNLAHDERMDVPADALALSRTRQINKEGYASRLKARFKAAKDAAKKK